MRSVKNPLGLVVLGIHKIPCLCWLCYIGQVGRSMSGRKKEHQRHLRLRNQFCHTIDGPQVIPFVLQIKILYKSSVRSARVIRESLEIHLTQEVVNKKEGLTLSHSLALCVWSKEESNPNWNRPSSKQSAWPSRWEEIDMAKRCVPNQELKKSNNHI